MTPEHTMDHVIGFEILATDGETASGRFEITDDVRQPYGIVHGGAYAAAAESLASYATAVEVGKDGNICMGMSNMTSFVRPASEGSIQVAARRRHRGRTSWIWEIDFTDDQGRLCAISRVTMAVRSAESA